MTRVVLKSKESRAENLLSIQSTESLKEMARQTLKRTDDGATEVFHNIMVKLEGRLSTNKYIEFCLSLEENF
jgi:hypothetical protein